MGTTFLPLPPLLPVVLFLVTSFSWQQNGGGEWKGDAAGRARSARDIQENNVVGRSRKRARGEGLNRENPEMGGGRRR